jgi:2,4-dienoyl-CoA reductase-like NADH-dependent reductase (Old Yellow Enzyme family)
MEDGHDGGLAAEAGARAIALMAAMGLDGVEISGGVGANSVRKGIKSASREAYFRPLAQLVRGKTDLPIILVGGLRSKSVMEAVLSSGDANFVALCRPLIREPNFTNMMKTGEQETSACISASNCWAENLGEGISCKCPPFFSLALIYCHISLTSRFLVAITVSMLNSILSIRFIFSLATLYFLLVALFYNT